MISNLLLEKLPSKTYRLSFEQDGQAREIFYTTKAQLVKIVNTKGVLPEIKNFLKDNLMSGIVIK